MEKNLVVGAGLSGAVMANLIADKLNEEVLVIDKKNHIAGNSYDYKCPETNITVHKYGPHIFHTNNKKVWDYLSKYTKWSLFYLKPNVMVEGKPVTFPFNLSTLYQLFSTKMAEEIEEKLIQKYGYKTRVSVLELNESNDKLLEFIGNYIYENVFLNYTMKQWGLKPDEIDPNVIARAPVNISHDDRYFQDKYQGIPLEGYTNMIKNILNHKNIEVRLNTDFKTIKGDFKRVFYSGAIDEYYDYKFGELPYRSLDFDIQIKNEEYFQKAVVTNYPNNYDFTRITEHKYFLNEKSDKTVISVEYPQAFEVGKNERYYPISNETTRALYEKYLELSKESPNLYFIGRLGEYKYINMDTAVEFIFDKFENLSK